MKNIVKMLGIIAMIAVIGLAVSCETDPEDQTQITITGFPSGANNKWAYIVLSKTKDGAEADIVGNAAAAKQISGGSFLNAIQEPGSDEAFDGDGDALFIFIGVGESATAAESAAKSSPTFKSDIKKTVNTGPDNTYDMKDFSPDAVELYGTANEIVHELYAGSYTCTYTPSVGDDRKEFIDLSEDAFTLWDNTDTTEESKFKFSITKGWEKGDKANATATAAGYTKGYKFTGIITAAPYVAATSSDPEALYGTKTAPNFNKADITNKTEATMYLYFSEDNDNPSFVRTAFSKADSNKSDVIITGKVAIREYKK